MTLRRQVPSDPQPQASLWQPAAAAACVLLGLAIVVNVELAGEANWFWYATLLHRGVHLYADLHLVLQPWYVLETNAWMRLAGTSCLGYQGIAVLHVLLLTASLWLVLRESRWADWQKAVVLFGCFVILIQFAAYRFDDFHVVADILYLLAMALLLQLARTLSPRRSMLLSAALGVAVAIAITNRLTDGGALFVAVLIALPFVARTVRCAAAGLYLATVALVWRLIILCTGDSWHDYVANSVIRAATAKGGTSNVLHGPAAALMDSLARMRISGKHELLALLLLAACGAAIARWGSRSPGRVFAAELAVAAVAAALHLLGMRALLSGTSIGVLSLVVQPLAYALALWITVRAIRYLTGRRQWDPREALIIIVVASLLSSAASQATGTSNSTNTLAQILLLAAVVCGSTREGDWLRASLLVWVAIAGIGGTVAKWRSPYAWGAAMNLPMFQNRVWYRHPLYGPMYLDRDQLALYRSICDTIAAQTPPGQSPQLLSIPISGPNYFCGIAPWRGYVQTWYDTISPDMVLALTQQLQSSPPEWIEYQRDTATLHAHEVEYNHGQPIAHRALDQLIVAKVASGQWTIAHYSDYLGDRSSSRSPGQGWYLIRTRP